MTGWTAQMFFDLFAQRPYFWHMNALNRSPKNYYEIHLHLLKRFIYDYDYEVFYVFLIERLVLGGLIILLLATPGMLVRKFAGLYGEIYSKIGIDAYVILKTVISFVILFSVDWSIKYPHWFLNLPIIIMIVDLFANLFGSILLRHFWGFPVWPNRSIICLIFNYFEFNVWFSCLYLYNKGLTLSPLVAQGYTIPGEIVKDSWHAFYFCIVTSATVGYGDITPNGNGQFITICHIVLSLGFLAAVVAFFIGTLSNKGADTTSSK